MHLIGGFVLLRGLVISVIEKGASDSVCSPGMYFIKAHYELYMDRLRKLDQ